MKLVVANLLHVYLDIELNTCRLQRVDKKNFISSYFIQRYDSYHFHIKTFKMNYLFSFLPVNFLCIDLKFIEN